MDELFPVDQIQMDSPKLAWIKKHGVKTHFFASADVEEGEHPWCAWMPDNDVNGIPDRESACGFGDTEEEAIRDLGVIYNEPLWNEIP